MELTSAAFNSGDKIPRKYTCDGEKTPPPLTWSGVPDKAKSLALLVEDPDAPRGIFTHWIIYGIPLDQTQLPEGSPSDAMPGREVMQGKNDFGTTGYGAPCPPPGPAHRYIFRIYALDQRPNLGHGANRRQFLDTIQGHVLAQAELTGRYARS